MLAAVENPTLPTPCADSPSDTTIQLWRWEITPHLANVGQARNLVREAASTLLNDDAAFDLAIATSEMVTNSIKAANVNGLTKPVVLELTSMGDNITLTCLDHNGQTPQARRIPPNKYLHHHTCKVGRWNRRDWKRWQRRHSLGKGIPLTDELSRNNGGGGLVVVRDGRHVRASLTMRIGVRPATSNLEAIFTADIAELTA
jgi:hypothetical protein